MVKLTRLQENSNLKGYFMKVLFISLIFSLFFSSCAHHHNKVGHHHHDCKENCQVDHKNEMFNKYCALSIAEGDTHVKGSDDYKLVHAGQTYYFSSQEKLQRFKNNLDSNAKTAQEKWRFSRQR